MVIFFIYDDQNHSHAEFKNTPVTAFCKFGKFGQPAATE
jgi:hypothetical protein